MPSADQGIRFYRRLGTWFVVLFLGGAGAWGALASLSGAVVAPAVVVAESYSKKVQHLEGGIVAEILVRNGERVEAGNMLIRLDATETRAGLQIAEAQLVDLEARRERLIAEREGMRELAMPAEITSGPTHDPVRKVWEGQQRLLKARLEARSAKKQQLSERIGQLKQAIQGVKAQQVSKERQLELIRKELVSLRTLEKDKLVTQNKLLALEREAVRLEGEAGQLVAEAARAEIQIGETQLQLLEIDQNTLTDVLAELREIEVRFTEVAEKAAALRARVARSQIVAPRAGIVHKLGIHTVGGVVAPGEAILEIVPEDDRLVLEARVDPSQIDQVKVGQPAVARFAAFDRRMTPELNARVTVVSPDARQDGPTLPAYYVARAELEEEEIGKLDGQKLQPGMPAELFIQTGERTALSYLVKPLGDQIARAFRER
jgi:HlyD family secretion protein